MGRTRSMSNLWTYCTFMNCIIRSHFTYALLTKATFTHGQYTQGDRRVKMAGKYVTLFEAPSPACNASAGTTTLYTYYHESCS